MITIDRNKCTKCGLCRSICHQGCIAIANDQLTIDRSLCSTCTHCIAICPQQALSWNGISPVAYEVTRLQEIVEDKEKRDNRRNKTE